MFLYSKIYIYFHLVFVLCISLRNWVEHLNKQKIFFKVIPQMLLEIRLLLVWCLHFRKLTGFVVCKKSPEARCPHLDVECGMVPIVTEIAERLKHVLYIISCQLFPC